MTELTNNGIITSYEYDANGNLTKKEPDTGVVTNYTYNKAGLLTELVSKNGSDEYTYSECTYLLNGLLSGVSMPYDGDNSSESKIKHYSYEVSNDPAGGIRRYQTYEEFEGEYIGDINPWRPWAETAK